MKVRLVYETDIPDGDCCEQFDALKFAVRNLNQDISQADSMDDLSDVFIEFHIDGVKQ